MIMSGSSLTRLEEVAAVGKHVWFQAYLPGKMDQIEALIARIQAAGYEKLVITFDTPVAANRENNVRDGFTTTLRPSLSLLVAALTHRSAERRGGKKCVCRVRLRWAPYP